MKDVYMMKEDSIIHVVAMHILPSIMQGILRECVISHAYREVLLARSLTMSKANFVEGKFPSVYSSTTQKFSPLYARLMMHCLTRRARKDA